MNDAASGANSTKAGTLSKDIFLEKNDVVCDQHTGQLVIMYNDPMKGIRRGDRSSVH